MKLQSTSKQIIYAHEVERKEVKKRGLAWIGFFNAFFHICFFQQWFRSVKQTIKAKKKFFFCEVKWSVAIRRRMGKNNNFFSLLPAFVDNKASHQFFLIHCSNAFFTFFSLLFSLFSVHFSTYKNITKWYAHKMVCI